MMAAIHLTARFCATARPKPGGDGKPAQTAYPDDDPKGLELRVSAEGRKVWCFRYRTLEGTQRRITLGVFAVGEDEEGEAAEGQGASQPLTLKAARSRARQIRGLVEGGRDPAADKRRQKAAAKAQPIKTFDDLADAYMRACEGGEWKPKGKQKRAVTLKGERGVLTRHIRPALGKLRVEDVSRAVVKQMLRKMKAAGIGAHVNKAQAIVRQCFAYAIAEERAAINPATGFSPLVEQKPRVRVLRDPELKALWAGLCDPGALTVERDGQAQRVRVGRPMAIALQLIALSLQRRAEVAGMRTDELDLDAGAWLIPAERMKGGRPHLVPLPPASVALVREAIMLAQDLWTAQERPKPNAFPVFPSPRDLTRSMRADSVTHAMAFVTEALGLEASPHDLRRTGSTALTSERLGVSPFIRSKVLGHAGDTGGGSAVSMIHYDANSYLAEKRRALAAWEGLLLEVVGDRLPAVNVRQFGGRA